MAGIRDELKSHNFWQYYVLDVKKEKEAVRSALADAPAWTGMSVARKPVTELAAIVRSSKYFDESKKFHGRYQVSVDPIFAASLIRAAFVDLQDVNALSDAWTRVVDVLNVPLYQEWEDDTEAALVQIRNRINYTRLEEHGPKWGEITDK